MSIHRNFREKQLTDPEAKAKYEGFESEFNVPNNITAAAIEEGYALLQDRTQIGYESIAELRAALLDNSDRME